MTAGGLTAQLHVLAGLAACAAVLAVSAAGCATASGVRYGAHTAEVLDAYAATRARSPVLVVVHGGGWTSGRQRDVASTCRTAVTKGYACFAIGYSLAPAFHWPVQLGELRDALAWTRAHAASYRGDPGRIGFWGYSAGGHLALEAAYRLPGVRVAVSWSGPTDLVGWYTTLAQRLLGCSSRCPDKQQDASPLAAAKTAKPTFIVHSTKDQIVPFSQSRELDARLTALGIDHAFLHLSGRAHAQGQWARAEAPTFAWLAGHL